METIFGNLEEYGTVVYADGGRVYMVGDRETRSLEDTPENRKKFTDEAKESIRAWLNGR